MATNQTILNPANYLNFIPPGIAAEFEISRNIYIGTLGALIWDMLVSLPREFWILRNGISPIVISYFLSRTSAFLYVLLSVIAKTRPNPNCNALEHAITSFWVLAISSSSFLFVRRVQALYAENKMVIWFFWILYVANVVLSFLTPIGSRASPLADTGYCINGGIHHYVAAAAFMPLAFDSLVFGFISYKVATEHGKPGRPVTLKTLITGDAFPRISRALLQGGQQYYLLTVILNILISILIITPGVPPIYEATFTIPDIAITSSMACRVYRNLRIAGSARSHVETYSTVKFNRTPLKVNNSDNATTQGTGTTIEDIWVKPKENEDIEMGITSADGASTEAGRTIHHDGPLNQKSTTTLKGSLDVM